jgi:hypothetical protein
VWAKSRTTRRRRANRGARFSRKCPDVQVTVKQLGTLAQLEALRAGRADLAFTILPGNVEPLVERVVSSEPLVVVLSAEHRLAGARQLRFDQIAREPMLILPRAVEPAMHDAFHALCRQAGVMPRSVPRFTLISPSVAEPALGTAAHSTGASTKGGGTGGSSGGSSTGGASTTGTSVTGVSPSPWPSLLPSVVGVPSRLVSPPPSSTRSVATASPELPFSGAGCSLATDSLVDGAAPPAGGALSLLQPVASASVAMARFEIESKRDKRLMGVRKSLMVMPGVYTFSRDRGELHVSWGKGLRLCLRPVATTCGFASAKKFCP